MWWSWLAVAGAEDGPIQLSKEVARVREEVRLELAPETCPEILTAVFHDLERLRVEEVHRSDLEAHSPEIVLGAFAARVEAQEAIARFAADGRLTHECVTALRRADIAARYLVDHVYEEVAPGGMSEWIVAGSGFAEEVPPLRSGDVLVSRATALSSAGIAHLGGVDSQFSHNALVWVGPDGVAYTVEAYMEKGAIVQTVDAFLADGLGRVVLLRHRDPELAARAAEAAHRRVSEGPFIPYDDLFHHDDGSALFCSEMPRWAYGGALGVAPTIPWDLTKFPRDTNGRFFTAMGIEGTETSMPADVLYDPSFSIVAEWRDPEILPRLRRHDAIAETAYRWMEEEGYEVDPSLVDEATVTVGLAMRRMPVLSMAVRDRLLPTSSPAFLVTGLAFDEAGQAIDEELVRRTGEGRGVQRAVWLAALEEMRAEDLSSWEREGEASFHDRMHPGAGELELRPDGGSGCRVGLTIRAPGAWSRAWTNRLPECGLTPGEPVAFSGSMLERLGEGGETCTAEVVARSGRGKVTSIGEGCSPSSERYLKKRVADATWTTDGPYTVELALRP